MKNFFANSILCLSFVGITISGFGQVTIYSEQGLTGTHQVLRNNASITLPYNVRSIKITDGYIAIMSNEDGCTSVCQYWRNSDGDGSLLGARGCNITVKQLDARVLN